MIKTAFVEKIENGYVVVSSVRSNACGDNCSMCGLCDNQKVYTKANSSLPVAVGDMVKIQTKTSSVLLGLSLVFLLPIFLPLVAYYLFCQINTYFGIVASILSLILCLLFIVCLSKNSSFLSRIQPNIVDIIIKK